jgi:UDP-N-acetylmuramoyl-L-alanyl-D-glutamate--2,6-diaminopimelate ligase
MDAYSRAKRRLFEGLERDAVAVVNADDPSGAMMAADLRASVVSYGMETPGVDVTAAIRELDGSGSTFVLRAAGFDIDIRCGLVGVHNVMNVIASAATALRLGVTPETIREAMARFDGVPGRLQRVTPGDCPFAVFVDYAHTDDALTNALQAIRPVTQERVICVFGCGGDRDRAKRPRMAQAVGRLADVAYVTSDNPRTEDPYSVIDDILPGFSPGSAARVEIQVDRRAAIEGAIAEARPGDTVLIAGKGHETYQLVGERVLDFDDAAVARACLGPAVAESAT